MSCQERNETTLVIKLKLNRILHYAKNAVALPEGKRVSTTHDVCACTSSVCTFFVYAFGEAADSNRAAVCAIDVHYQAVESHPSHTTQRVWHTLGVLCWSDSHLPVARGPAAVE